MNRDRLCHIHFGTILSYFYSKITSKPSFFYLHDNTIYDLQGLRVAPQHMIEGHIYIQNGRKFRK